MVETNDFTEEFFPDNEYYVLYTPGELNPEETYAIYYKITNVIIDKEGGNGEDVTDEDELVSNLYNHIHMQFSNLDHDLSEDVGLSRDTQLFKVYPEYKGTHYVVTFKSA